MTILPQSNQLHGVIVPMVTPLTLDGALDLAAVERLVQHLIAGGVSAVFVLGTTGEALSLTGAQGEQLVAASVAAAGGRIPVIAGIASNCLADSLARAHAFAQCGAHAVAAHLPFYFPLCAAEQEAWFDDLAAQTPLPLLLYNIPQTTHQDLPLPAVVRLSQHPRVIGIKDSSPDPERIAELLSVVGNRSDFCVLIGASARYRQGLDLGAAGIVPSAGNLDPALCHALCHATPTQRVALEQELLALNATYQAGKTVGSSIVALKGLLAARGLCGPTVLPPLRREP